MQNLLFLWKVLETVLNFLFNDMRCIFESIKTIGNDRKDAQSMNKE